MLLEDPEGKKAGICWQPKLNIETSKRTNKQLLKTRRNVKLQKYLSNSIRCYVLR